ncbi:DUF2867 domain-containing protein [Mesorhizobium sp. CGMCC 1.15528]|uniref:DUF2867 domain-containing protein n=1 Tax=Mesorhizobium zhangyense TaxID=1776730 RepID=A0A7C9R7G3_9HYPH|nr:DUF2867 domain-containing protein [Mesorhizobium zhangyense]NGN41997.1 DUF2867 domain-containing protein [Mesorhizobium zhangyense]
MPAVQSFPKSGELLPGASFADRYAVVIDGQAFDAITAAERAILNGPAWVSRLLALRNLLVKPFGLKTGGVDLQPHQRQVGMFPVISQTASRVVLGLDDRHLDFRLLVDVKELGEGRQEVSASTLVAPHNWLGRVYLAIIMPFHRIIVPAMLARVGRG